MPIKQIKKILGIIVIIVGFIALITPFTPGASLLLFLGCQLLGVHFAFFDKLFPQKGTNSSDDTTNESLKKPEDQSKIVTKN